MNLEVFVLGTGGMMPLPGRGLTSALVRREGELFLFDCGEGTQIGLRRLNLRWKKITSIFISHTHADHVTGLPGILMLSSQVDRDEPLYIYGPPKIREFVEAMRRTLDMYINYEIIVREVEGKCTIVEAEDYVIRSHPLQHTKQCLGYCIEEKKRPGIFFPEKALALNVPRGPLWSRLQGGETVNLPDGTSVRPGQVMGDERNGRKFCFVTDTVAAAGLADFVSGADLLICEGMFADELAETAAEKRHLTAAQAARIARDGKVKEMGLIHYSPRYSDRELKKLLQEAREIFPAAFLTRDLQHIEMPFEE
ncbi:MAG TPA: ribonuclease Z [Spirochaetia bacterium]|nr:ribonuclease Z [Spirochaetia bacterium]